MVLTFSGSIPSLLGGEDGLDAVVFNGLPAAEKLTGSPNEVVDKIQKSIANLHANDYLFIATDGTVHKTKGVFTRDCKQILFSVRAEDDGNFSIWPGLPILCHLYVGTGEKPSKINSSATELEHSIVLGSGDWFALNESTIVQIPGEVSSLGGSAIEKDIAAFIAVVPEGESVTIGRTNFTELDDNISRLHASIEILERTVNAEGSLNIRLKMAPGIKGQEHIWVLNNGESTYRLDSRRTVPPGTKLFTGMKVGKIEIPHGAESEMTQLRRVYRKLRDAESWDASSAHLKTIIKPADRGAFTIDGLERSRRFTSPGKAAHFVELRMIEHFVRDGLLMIRDGQYEEARTHLYNQTIAAGLGYTFEENNCAILEKLTDRAATKNLHSVASRSWFKPHSKHVYPSTGMLARGVSPQNADEMLVHERWQRELSMIVGEEWTHGFQLANGGPVSRKGALTLLLPDPLEADVALYFHEMGVPLSHDFVKSRYQSRALAFQLIKGVQTEHEQSQLKEIFERLPVGKSMVLTGPRYNAQSGVPTLAIDPRAISAELSHFEKALVWRETILGLNQRASMTITKLESGRIALESDYGSRVYAPDAAGYYQPVQGKVEIEAGTPFHFAWCFRFIL